VDAQGNTLPPGKSGNVIISNLVNRGTVLLNYPVGDVARILPEKCPCGRTLPLLSHLEGRVDEWIELPSGRRIPPPLLPRFFKIHQEIWQFQLVQESLSRFTAYVVCDEACNRQSIRARLTADLLSAIAEPVQVDVRFVDAIPRTHGRKVRPVISLQAKARLAPEQAGSASTVGVISDGKGENA
jgi:phenylacetate-CoA ligase